MRQLLLGPARTGVVVIAAAIPILMAAALLWTPDVIFSRKMVWDFLFPLSGAWRIENGQIPYVDFHDPLGPINFQLPRLGFWIVGPAPHAFLIGEFVVLFGVFAAASLAAIRRLPTIPAIVFVVYASLLAVVPVNVGDFPNAFSLAMSYNHWGWSTLAILCLTLFVEPRHQARGWTDAVLGFLLLAFLFYVKITFALLGLVATLLAMMWMRHVQAARLQWAVVLVALMADAASPRNWPYLADVWQAATAGYVRWSIPNQLFRFVANDTEYALYGLGILALFLLWRHARVGGRELLSALTVLTLGIVVQSQNSQTRGNPVGIVIVFLVYHALRRQESVARDLLTRDVSVIFCAVLLAPCLSVASQMTTVVGYQRAATRQEILRFGDTNLRGLSTDLDPDESRAASSRTRDRLPSTNDPGPLVSAHAVRSPSHYLHTLMEAAELFAGDRLGRPRILTFDQVNPMPFALGYPPPRGGNLWMALESPPVHADNLLRDVDVVLVPKYSSNPSSTLDAWTRYGGDVSRRFPVREDTASWTMFSRARSPR